MTQTCTEFLIDVDNLAGPRIVWLELRICERQQDIVLETSSRTAKFDTPRLVNGVLGPCRDDPDYADAIRIETALGIPVLRHDEKKPGGIAEVLAFFEGKDPEGGTVSELFYFSHSGIICVTSYAGRIMSGSAQDSVRGTKQAVLVYTYIYIYIDFTSSSGRKTIFVQMKPVPVCGCAVHGSFEGSAIVSSTLLWG